MQGGKAALQVVTSRQGMPAGLGGPSVPRLPTGHLISPEPTPEPLAQAGLLQPLSFSPALHVLKSQAETNKRRETMGPAPLPIPLINPEPLG